ncbi:MAG TPA: transketolase C-terminal domain-containing protein, partial [Planctomycetota bacterium]|nr:transketolase C-terminal domain-containing protein [Planctomycetota bacterium]
CGGRIVTVEDNYPGGIGSAVAEALLECAGTFKLEQLCVRRVPKSARTHDELIEHLGLSADRIVNTVVMMLEGAER